MARQDLHNANIDALFQESGRETMAKGVRCEWAIETTRRPCTVESPAGCASGKRRCVLAVGEEPLGAAMVLPDLAEHGQCRLGQWQGSLFVAFADDPQDQLLGVDG